MKKDKYAEKITKAEEKLQQLMQKREALDAEIKSQTEVINTLKAQSRADELDEFGIVAENNNLTIEELMTAIKSGNFYAIQEKIENLRGVSPAKKTAPSASSEPAIPEEVDNA